MSYHYSYMLDEGLGILAGLFSSIPSCAIGIACYVLTALGLYTIAKRRGIRNPWLAWIPVADVWILGSLSDQYRYVARGEIKSKRKILLVLNIILAVLGVAIAVVAIVLVVNALGGLIYSASEAEILERILMPMLGILGLCLPLLGVAIAKAVIYYMALYDVYTSCDPGNNVLFLVLSIVFGITQPFFLFFSRKKDDGMPPRRPQPFADVPPQQPPQEHWENGPDYL